MPRVTRSSQAKAVRAIVEPIASSYALLATFPYLPASDVLIPPAAGWPQRDIVNFRKLGKTDFVIEILKHLPYIRTDFREWRLAYDDTTPIAYVEVTGASNGAGFALAALEGPADQAVLWDKAIEPHGQRLDAHVIALTHGGLYGAWLLLDTEASTITDFSLLGGISSGIHSHCPKEDWDAGLVWKQFPSKPIKDFFEDWKEKYNSLEWMPIQEKHRRASGEIFSQERMGTASNDPAVRDSKDIYGLWLGSADFQKEECRDALRDWVTARGKRIVEEHGRLVRANPNRRPSPPDPLDEFSD